MKKPLVAAVAALFVLTPMTRAQAPAKRPTPSTSGGVSVSTSPTPPPGSKPAEVQDIRLLPGGSTDAYELERLGDAAARANELGRAREFFEQSWKAGELPTAAYNLACIDTREAKHDAAFAHLEKAIGAGFDDERSLLGDPDLTPLRSKPKFNAILSGARKNRATGDASVVSEGIFVAPPRPAAAILVLLHDASSDPLAASGPFADNVRARGLFLAVPRGPARAGRKRFGWGTAERAYAAVDSAVEAARKKSGSASIPVLIVGVGRGGTLAYTVAARKPGVFVGVASIGGPYDPGVAGSPESASYAGGAGLRGARLFLGIPRDAPPNLLGAFRRGREALSKLGLDPSYVEWPGAGMTLPKNTAGAVKETLDALTGTGAPRKA